MNTARYLPDLLGPVVIQADGDDQTAASKINFAGQTGSYNATTDTLTLTPGSVGAVPISALAIDWALGGVFTKTLAAGGNTFTFTNAASGMVIIVRLTGAASTVTWPTVKWAGGVAPTQTASGTDVYTFVHDGTSIYGSFVQDMS